MAKRDTVYQQAVVVQPFVFNAEVSDVFADMLQRSIPGYGLLLDMIALLAARKVQAYSYIYDLGCSHGAVSLTIARQLANNGASCRVIAVDSSINMLKHCQHNIETCAYPLKIYPFYAKVENTPIHYASVVVLNFTLQFVAVNQRLALLQRIYQGMNKGAVLVISEKIQLENNNGDMVTLYHDFKRMNGYSDLEINQKQAALNTVLVADTLAIHQNRLQAAGFKKQQVWFQSFNFYSILAWK